MTARLPTPGGDDDNWGDILNAYLEVSLSSTGTLNAGVVGTAQIQNNAVTNAQLDSTTQTSLTKANAAVQSVNGKSGTSITLAASDVSAIPASQLGAASGVATLDSGTHLTAAQLPGSVVIDSQAAVFPLGNYANLQAAINACSTAGGGIVQLPAGATPVSTTIQMMSGVILAGPLHEWSTWWTGSPPDPTPHETAWLQADGSTGPVVEFATNVVGAGVRDLLIMANGRVGISLDYTTTERGGNRLRNVYVSGGSTGVYVGQLETRIVDLLVLHCTGDGLQVDASDCQIDGSILTGFNGGNGITLTTNSGGIRCSGAIDTFNNTLDGIAINGTGHRIALVQSNNNGNRGIAFLTTFYTVLMHVNSSFNGRVYDGITNTTRYPDVEFAHPTSGNIGCGIMGGYIWGDGTESRGVHNAEHTITFPLLHGISFIGTFAGSAGPAGYVSSQSLFNVRGCYGVPDFIVPSGGSTFGVGVLSRPNGPGDQYQWTDGSGNALSGIKNNGALYLAVKAQTLASNGAVTIDASATNVAAITLQANATSSSITNPTAGQYLTIEWIQDGTGSRTYAWPANCMFAGGAAPSASTTAGYTDSVTFRYDGTNWKEIARAVAIH